MKSKGSSNWPEGKQCVNHRRHGECAGCNRKLRQGAEIFWHRIARAIENVCGWRHGYFCRACHNARLLLSVMGGSI